MTAEKALSGLKVLDLGHYIAGPYCTKLAAGFGADVLKVEKPGGDPARRLGPFFKDEPHPERSGLFLYLNTSKKSITLNLKTKMGKKIIRQLLKEADVLVENFSPRVMPSLGLDYDTVKAINPGIIMTSISNFGQTGPYKDYRSWDIGMYAMGGMMYVTGDPDREPLTKPAYLAQYQGGLYGFLGTLMALYYRDVSGRGQHIDVAIAETIASIIETTTMYWTYKKEVFKRFNLRPNMHPYGAYPCKDGYAGFMAFPGRRWPEVAKLTGIKELLDPKYEDGYKRSQLHEEVDALIQPWLMEHNKEEIYHAGQALGLTFGYVCTPEDLLKSPQLKAREYFIDIEHPETGKLPYPGAPFKMSETPWHMERAPLLGEHNEEIYCHHLGFSKDDMVKLKQQGVI